MYLSTYYSIKHFPFSISQTPVAVDPSFINTTIILHHYSINQTLLSFPKMKQKALVLLLYIIILLAAFFSSLIPSTIAVPSSRTLKFMSDETTSNQHLSHEFQKRERMDIEVADYSGTGANNHHDPRAPPGSY